MALVGSSSPNGDSGTPVLSIVGSAVSSPSFPDSQMGKRNHRSDPAGDLGNGPTVSYVISAHIL